MPATPDPSVTPDAPGPGGARTPVVPAEPQPGVPSTTHEGLPDNATLLDVREQDEWDLGHAPDAVHIPLAQLPDRLGDLPQEQPIVVTCRSGGRSSRAVAYLLARGYDAVNLEGGMLAWFTSNRPMAHAGAGIPEVR